MALSEKQENEILTLFKNYSDAYSKKDKRALKEMVSPGISGFGSGPDEIFLDRDDLMTGITRDFSQAGSVIIEFPDIWIQGEGRVAWITGLCIFVAKVENERVVMSGRLTAVVRNTGRRWIFEQLHFSVPNVEQEPGQSFA